MKQKRRISILGSTGSIGANTLEVIASHPDRFEVVALAAGSNLERLLEQARRFRPLLVAVREREDARSLSQTLPAGVQVAFGAEGLKAVASHPKADFVVSAIVGAAGLEPTLAAVQAKKNVAIANKESLVMAGSLLTVTAKKQGASLLPIDSEHSAIFQLLEGEDRSALDKVILTASGGPFFRKTRGELSEVSPEEALRHPRWQMGRKITIDSATLTNKALEVIEGRWLFDLRPSQIEVVIHPQSIVHSLVAFRDGSMLAQMAVADMKIPIAYALSYPERISVKTPPLDLIQMGALEFYPPDVETFPILSLAYRALESESSAAVALNAANEVAVQAFLDRQIPFLEIYTLVREVFEAHRPVEVQSIEEILSWDAWARERAYRMLEIEIPHNPPSLKEMESKI
jgi:1-deoxy-D-xylulose-5-phosphate reductoisomerase